MKVDRESTPYKQNILYKKNPLFYKYTFLWYTIWSYPVCNKILESEAWGAALLLLYYKHYSEQCQCVCLTRLGTNQIIDNYHYYHDISCNRCRTSAGHKSRPQAPWNNPRPQLSRCCVRSLPSLLWRLPKLRLPVNAVHSRIVLPQSVYVLRATCPLPLQHLQALSITLVLY